MAYTKSEFKEKHFTSKELSQRWDETVLQSMHFRQKTPSLTDLHYRRVVHSFLENNAGLAPQARVLKLDLYNEATGTSHIGFFLERKSAIIGVEISSRISRQASRKMEQSITAIAGDIRFLPFQNHSFDVVFSLGTLEHVQPFDQAKVVAEIHRVLKPGGKAILGVNNRLSLWLTPVLFEFLEWTGLTHRHWSYEPTYRPSYLRTLLLRQGFRGVYSGGTYLLPKFLRIFDMWTHERYGLFWRSINVFKSFFYKPILSFLEWVEARGIFNRYAEQTIAIGYKTKKSHVEK